MKHLSRIALPALILALAVLALCGACKGAPPDSSGAVRLWQSKSDAALPACASVLPELTLSAVPRTAAWNVQLREEPDSIDLLYLDWDRNIPLAGDAGLLAGTQSWRSRMPSLKHLWPCLSRSDAYGDGRFIPASAYTWGLFYNREALASRGIPVPKTWREFEAALGALQNAGVQPIALGSSFGWPATAWLSYLDLRLNGAAKHRALLALGRPFDSKDLLPVYETLQKWRDEGRFDPESGAKNWIEAMNAVASGEAAFILLPASVWPRFPNQAGVGFAAVPASPGKWTGRGELVGVQGFALSARAQDAEAALALTDACIAAGSGGQADESFRVSSLRPADGASNVPGVASENRANGAEPSISETETAILKGARVAFPQMDRALPEQAAYDVNQIMIRFFAPGSRMNSAELATALAGATKNISAERREADK